MSARWVNIPVERTAEELLAMLDDNTRNEYIAPFYLSYVRDAILENIPGLTASQFAAYRFKSYINFRSKYVDADTELFTLEFYHDTHRLRIRMYDTTICHTHVYWARGLSSKFIPRCITAIQQSYLGHIHIKLAETTTKYEQLVRGLTRDNYSDVDALAMQLLLGCDQN